MGDRGSKDKGKKEKQKKAAKEAEIMTKKGNINSEAITFGKMR